MKTYFATSYLRDGKRWAEVMEIGSGENIVYKVRDYDCMDTMLYVGSKKKAQEVVDAWNDGYRQQGIHMYSHYAEV